MSNLDDFGDSMKLTSTITDLLFDLSELETPSNTQFLIGDGTVLRNNLLKLYRATKNNDSHELIIKIMSEAGYPWFAKLARSANRIMFDSAPEAANSDDYLMSEEEFLELIPANGHFH